MTVQYKETRLQFQREVNGESLCRDDKDEDSNKEEDCVEDANDDADEDNDDDADDEADEDNDEDNDDNDNNVGKTEYITPTSPTSCTHSVTYVGTVGDSSSNLVTNSLAKSANYSKGLTVFGINILATSEVPDSKLLHAANITAELIDNNEDGKQDNACVTAMLNELSTYVSMYNQEDGNSVEINPDPLDEVGADKYAGLGAYETVDNYADGESHDASIEEIFHLITQHGYSNVYPRIFGESNTSVSTLAKAMDVARGGEQRCAEEVCEWIYNNTSCPLWSGLVEAGDAWYFYADETADYATQMTEYIYWSVSSNFGLHDSSAGHKKAKSEWCPNTKEKLKAQDTTIYNLINDPKYAFPAVLPNASYSYYTFKKSDIKTF